jgi:glutamyl-tRNA synthetase
MKEAMISFRKTRLAPSPTGALHLGHARTFLVTWWMARQCGAEIVMRMEDLDAGRRKDESVQQAYDDLAWLGMDWDGGPIVQSHRAASYQETLESLFHRGVIYPCTCTRKEIAEAVAASAGAPHEGEETPRYPGTCRANLGKRVDQMEKPACWRLKVDPGEIAFDDAIAGPQALDVALDAGDFPLTRFDGTPAYQLAVVTDDHAMDIDMVIRGDDLLSSTPRQIAIYKSLGWAPPKFAHVPLVIGADGKRLAKRHGESRIAQFREAGVSAKKIIGWAAWRSGQIDKLREISIRDVLADFDLARLPRKRIVLDADDLKWLA